jgi:hypothetical protein
MMDQLPFPKVRHDHPDTARAAASQAWPVAKTQRERVLWAVKFYTGHGGMTDEELQHYLELDPSTERPRRVELVERGLIVDSGERRKTRSGRSAIVWRAV